MLTALAFLTPLPVSGRAPTGRTFLWFPIFGAMMGGVSACSGAARTT